MESQFNVPNRPAPFPFMGCEEKAHISIMILLFSFLSHVIPYDIIELTCVALV